MTKENDFKKKLAQDREEAEARLLKEKEALQEDMRQRSQMDSPKPKRSIEFAKDANPNEIYEEWLKEYKQKHPGFDADKNKFSVDENGVGHIHFNDPQAEEDFVRTLADANENGGVLDKGIQIARFEGGKLIDPRTNKEFPEGGYASLVQQLDSGIAYDDIPSPESSAPSPFKRSPYG
jgi:beta-xylosidase